LSDDDEETPELRAAPLKEDVVKAAALVARTEAVASFMLGKISLSVYFNVE
jgi:hypothetical protein